MSNIDFNNLDHVTINTGNILSIKDITKKANQNPTEELIEAIKYTIKDIQSDGALDTQADHFIVLNRQKDDLQNKLNEYDSSELKIGVKIFLNEDAMDCSLKAIEKAFLVLKVGVLSDAIVSFKQKQSENKKDNLEQIKIVWQTLETLVREEKIKQLGIADVEELTFRALYDWAVVKPSIIQINLATCCVVPPTLQAFCKEKDLKLLTHSDPADILPSQSVEEIFHKSLSLKWALRYTIHIKERGVLITKGYLVNLSNS